MEPQAQQTSLAPIANSEAFIAELDGFSVVRGGSEPIFGVDYLTDFYAVLGVGRDAGAQEILAAYHEKAKEYHPDLVARAGSEIKGLADERTKLIREAYDVLSNRERRQAYDELLASFDPVYVSTSGVPIVNLERQKLDLMRLLRPDDGRRERGMLEILKTRTAYDPATFAAVQAIYRGTPDPSAELQAAYRNVLQAKSVHLGGEETIAWEAIGVSNPAIPRVPGKAGEYLRKVEDLLGSVRAILGPSVTHMLRAVGSREAAGLLPLPAHAPAENMAHGELARSLTEAACESFDSRRGRVVSLARARAEALDELLKLTDWRYLSGSEPKVESLVLLVTDERKVVMGFQCLTVEAEGAEGPQVRFLPIDVPQGQHIDSIERELFEKQCPGSACAVMEFDPELEPRLQISYVLACHLSHVTGRSFEL